MEGISETLSKKGGATVTVTHLDHDGESIPLATFDHELLTLFPDVAVRPSALS